ncbi:hypothetical protein [Trichoplusia ni ascovirus 2c]|uniref:Uncharacterized protein ORF150 n=1 Tax=Trichoplusia ni ascovirus 2c TaxID=328615 RepID=Y150_TNAVC|nr:hypothetical protein TNAV2c_gp150 [Trichoplusia ni ascovirus 2c]Q06VD3.1 RecName: Full=Uncharacterized protein ORF150 [Trichoplusia ni ascovirus 2c]ABF70666.1 hypothetical protein [Trichoplusia ni ascovirus 2c]
MNSKYDYFYEIDTRYDDDDYDDDELIIHISKEDEQFLNLNSTHYDCEDDEEKEEVHGFPELPDKLTCPPAVSLKHILMDEEAATSTTPTVILGDVSKHTRPCDVTSKYCNDSRCVSTKLDGIWTTKQCKLKHIGESEENYCLRLGTLRNDNEQIPKLKVNQHPSQCIIEFIATCMRDCGPKLKSLDIIVSPTETLSEHFANRFDLHKDIIENHSDNSMMDTELDYYYY